MSIALALYCSHPQYSIQFLRTVLQSLRRISTVYTTLSSMSDLTEPGFKTSDVLSSLASVFEKMPDAEKKSQIKKTNGVFQLNVKNSQGKEAIWVIDLKNEGKVTKGPANRPDVSISLSDDTFIGLADGKVNAQKAFMTGGLKVKGNIMLATKLDAVLKNAKAKL
ncbi:hypothetical protein AYX14_06432 [Cryptococcus neoformans]|nr:hypothetical protein AYX15_06308 [Cryptococcus neoformans var. grubii]OWZ64608.1 hypothetical protein AYX14_06432 [Cryptococcus neoformans var. grubii]